MKREELTIDFSVFENSTRFLGITQATMPTLSYLIAEMSGAGIAGRVEDMVAGHFEPMTISLNFRTPNKEQLSLAAPCRHHVELRAALQENDTTSGGVKINQIKHVFTLKPKTVNLGNMQPASPSDGASEFAVHYWKYTHNGNILLEYDPLNYICTINGTDYLADVREALGIDGGSGSGSTSNSGSGSTSNSQRTD